MRLLAAAAIVIALVVAALVLTAPSRRIPADAVYGRDGPATKAAILKIIPLGSTVDAAKAAMEARGFQCGLAYGRTHFGTDPTNPQRQIVYPPADVVWCDSGKRWAGWRSLVLDMEWQVTFVMKDGAVDAVDVYITHTGP